MANMKKSQNKSAHEKDVAPANEDAVEAKEVIGQINGYEAHNTREVETSILEATRLLMREYGVRKSAAAVRDLVEKPHTVFAPAEAVSALSNSGFKASFGAIKLKKLDMQYFPLIAFKKNGSGVLIKGLSDDDKFIIGEPHTKSKFKTVSRDTVEADYSGYVIIVKELTLREKEDRSGHWFFSAFKKSKWLYVQVMIAAMVSNFLSLTVAVFTMTVYDRIIPNAAFESLIALSIGVVIALGFDFLIKSLRAKFIDVASKKPIWKSLSVSLKEYST